MLKVVKVMCLTFSNVLTNYVNLNTAAKTRKSLVLFVVGAWNVHTMDDYKHIACTILYLYSYSYSYHVELRIWKFRVFIN